MKGIDLIIVGEWTNDPSFINWANLSNDTDIAKWEAFFNAHPKKWELAKIAKEIVLGVSFKAISINKAQAERSFATLLSTIEKKEGTKLAALLTQKTKSNTYRIPKRWLVAASVAILIFVGGYASLEYFKNSEIYVSTGYGEQKEIALPEGSFVILNANSSMKYKRDTPREIVLEGEAFFEIAKIPETNENFKVSTHDLVVIVLGTSFNVNARNDQTKVFLEEGKVELEMNNAVDGLIEMAPGDEITYSKKHNKQTEKRKNVSVLENASWKEGALMFNKISLVDALYDIEDIYGIHFIIESEGLRELEITGGIPIKDLKVTLETLKDIYGIQIRIEGKRYFISK